MRIQNLTGNVPQAVISLNMYSFQAVQHKYILAKILIVTKSLKQNGIETPLCDVENFISIACSFLFVLMHCNVNTLANYLKDVHSVLLVHVMRSKMTKTTRLTYEFPKKIQTILLMIHK